MKKQLICLATFLLMSGLAFADPHIKGDPVEGATKYKVELYERNGEPISDISESAALVDSTIYHDLANVPLGSYKGRVWSYAADYTFTNEEGETSHVRGWSKKTSPFVFIAKEHGGPTGLGLVE